MITRPTLAEVANPSTRTPNKHAEKSATGLRPCPFCGSVKLTQITFPPTETHIGWATLQCDDCAATGPAAETKEQARIKWDIRGEPA